MILYRPAQIALLTNFSLDTHDSSPCNMLNIFFNKKIWESYSKPNSLYKFINI